MFKELQKIWKDTTTNTVTGKYSQKRLMMWGAYRMAMFLCIVSVVELHTNPEFDLSLRVPDLGLVITLFSVAIAGSVTTLAGQYFNRKTADDNGQPLAPPAGMEPPIEEPKNE